MVKDPPAGSGKPEYMQLRGFTVTGKTHKKFVQQVRVYKIPEVEE